MVRKKIDKKAAKPEEKKEDKVFIHVLYSQTTTGGEPESDDRWSNRSDENISTHFKGVVITADGDKNSLASSYDSWRQVFEAPREAFAEPRPVVFAVVGYYSDGDTFGSSYGNMFIVDVYGNLEKANAVAEQLRYEDRNSSAEKNPSIFGGSGRYVPWGGYFSRLERIEVEVLHVLLQSMNPADTKPSKDPKDIPSW